MNISQRSRKLHDAEDVATHNMANAIVKQHLIDPELCIRCNSCEEHCPVGAIRNNGVNYVVEATLCNSCRKCVPDCPTGAIDNWWPVLQGATYPITEQYTWEKLPVPTTSFAYAEDSEPSAFSGRGAPRSAATPVENRYTRDRVLLATLKENTRLTHAASMSDIRHLVLEVGTEFPFLEGQSIGIIPPGFAANGKRQSMRLYSIASAREGESGIPGTLALTVKRVLENHEGKPYRGICSNFVCDLRPNDCVDVVGPYGTSFLMPEAPQSSLLMIATGTGIAPMRGMIAHRLRFHASLSGHQILFYGGRTPGELPYYDELKRLPEGFLDLNLAFSRVSGQPKQYVQDLLCVRHQTVVALLANPNCYIYLCGLKGMEAGVLEAFHRICAQHAMAWGEIEATLKSERRLHIETY